MTLYKALTIFILIISGFAFTFFTPLNFLINFAHDDSFFYIKTALNSSQGFGSTFDRVNITNGYHPLWFLILASYYFLLNSISSFSPEYIYRFTVLLQIIISASTLYFISRLFRANNDDSNYKKKYFLFIPLYIILVYTRDFGMESQLACLLFSICCFLKSEELYRQKNFAVLKSLLLCLLFLTRTDYFFSIVPFMVFFDYYTSDLKTGLRQLIISTVMLTFTTVSYFLFNKMTYGYFLTISAVSKNTFPDIIFIQNMENLVSSGPMLIHFLKSVCMLIVISLFLFSKKIPGARGRINVFLFGSVCGSFLFVLFNFCFNTHGLREWYITFPSFAALILFISSSGFSNEFFRTKFTILIIICSVYFYITRMNNLKWDSAYEYALNLKRVTASDDRIFQIDFCGVTGFFSERKIINGDGLINSFEYRDFLNAGRLKEYLASKQINLYSTHSESGMNTVKDSAGYYIDKRYSNKFGGYDFVFPENDLFFKMPFSYDHSLYHVEGDWYLFKIQH